MRTNVCVWVVLACVACGDDDDLEPVDAGQDSGDAAEPVDAEPPDSEVVDAGPSCTVSLYGDGEYLTDWPDSRLLVPDEDTGTGWRLDPSDVRFGDFTGFDSVFAELAELDGFGSNAPVIFRFGRAWDLEMLPNADATMSPAAGLGLVVLESTPRIEPVLVDTTDEGHTLLLQPLHPLPEQTWAIAFVTDRLAAAAGDCLMRSEALAAQLASPDERTTEALATLETLGIIEDPDELVSLVVFPVQSLTEDSRAVAADVATRDFVLAEPPVCEASEHFRQCETRFVAQDYRGSDGVLRRDPSDPIAPSKTYELPITIWLPVEGDGPFPTVIWGSGLGSGREQGVELAELSAPLGYATIAIDPVTHGEHPDVLEGESTATLPTVIRFFTIGDLRTSPVRPLVMRENWRQSAWDKLQLVKLLKGGLDVIGDSAVDLDISRLAYLGVSLGGIMGPELIALSPDIRAGVLVVPGGNVTSIMSDSAMFSAFINLLKPPGSTAGDVRRFFVILQTMIDAGDAASYAPHILRDRFDASLPPSIIAGVALDDTIVPNSSSWSLMRALGLPLIGAELRPVPGIELGPAPPVSGNLDAMTTAGFLQFDVITENDGMIEDASHNNVPASDQGIHAWFEFLEASFEAGLPVIDDPYSATGLAHEM